MIAHSTSSSVSWQDFPLSSACGFQLAGLLGDDAVPPHGICFCLCMSRDGIQGQAGWDRSLQLNGRGYGDVDVDGGLDGDEKQQEMNTGGVQALPP